MPDGTVTAGEVMNRTGSACIPAGTDFPFELRCALGGRPRAVAFVDDLDGRA